jgi:hypothetical protein
MMLTGYDKKYGTGNWKLAWQYGEWLLDFADAVQIYEDAYFFYLKNQTSTALYLHDNASDVFDNQESNIKSGFDYSIQEAKSTHLQDISIRRAMKRLGLGFRGMNPIQIRHSSIDPIGKILSPGRVLFHKPERIVRPQLTGWWQADTIEAFWQSNKHLLVSKGMKNNIVNEEVKA